MYNSKIKTYQESQMARTQQSPGLNQPFSDILPLPVIAKRAPTTNDRRFEIGSIWIDESTNQAWTLTSVASGSASWILSASGAGDINTINSLNPTAGNVVIAGGSNVTDSNAGSTVTLNLDPAITLATSITVPLITTAAGTDLSIESATGQDIIMKMGDNAGGNKVSFLNSDNVEKAAINSVGNFLFSSLSVGGSFIQTLGAVSISEDNQANSVGIAGGTVARVVNLASSAAAHVVSIGSTTGAASLTLSAGTGDVIVNGTVKEIDAEFLFTSGTDLVITQSPIMQTALNTGGVPTGADGDVNLMYMQDGALMEQFIIGTQTIIAPRMDANGLNIALDQTVAEGVEYNFGPRANAKHTYTIGTDDAFFMEIPLKVEDLSGCALLMIGFRKVATNEKVLVDYSDFAVIGLRDVTSATNVVILDRLNLGTTGIVDTTDAWSGGDTGTETLAVFVTGAGVVTYRIAGVAPTVTAPYTFDDGDVVMPVIHILQSADLSGTIDVSALKIGFQS